MGEEAYQEVGGSLGGGERGGGRAGRGEDMSGEKRKEKEMSQFLHMERTHRRMCLSVKIIKSNSVSAEFWMSE